MRIHARPCLADYFSLSLLSLSFIPYLPSSLFPVMIPANLVKFFKKFVPASTADTVSKFMGDPNGRQEGIEADLDIQCGI